MPTLTEFQRHVAAGEIHCYVSGGTGGAGRGADTEASKIAEWVTGAFTATTVGNTTVYDLTSPAAS